MFYIGVCDDELAVCEQVSDSLQRTAKAENLAVEITLYKDGQRVWEDLEDGKRLQLFFLDIEMDRLDGVELGRKIRDERADQLMQIVYISGKRHYAMDLFQVRPLNFLIKPLTDAQLATQLHLAMELCAELEKTCFHFQIEKEFRQVPFGDILYFESLRKKLRIITTHGEVECYGKIGEVEAQAPDISFIRIHKSYLLNEAYVVAWSAEVVELQNGHKLPVGRTHRVEVNKRLMEIHQCKGR